jgi:hypothetical protein
VSRGRKAHPVLKAGDKDGDDLARWCPILFFVYLFFFCSLSPLILSSILFYFFFSCSLFIFFFVFSPCFSLVFSPCSCVCVLVLQEKWTVSGELIYVVLFTWIVPSELIYWHLNGASWISLGTVHLNSVSTVHETASDPVRKKLFFLIVFYLKS